MGLIGELEDEWMGEKISLWGLNEGIDGRIPGWSIKHTIQSDAMRLGTLNSSAASIEDIYGEHFVLCLCRSANTMVHLDAFFSFFYVSVMIFFLSIHFVL